MSIKKSIIIISCFLSMTIFGQSNNLKFENLDTVDGLSSSTILEIFQDKEGFLWFAWMCGGYVWKSFPCKNITKNQ